MQKDIEALFMGGQQKKFDNFMDQIKELTDWFEKQWPESDLRMKVNLDNKKVPELQVLCRVLTGKEMTDNQGFFEKLTQGNLRIVSCVSR